MLTLKRTTSEDKDIEFLVGLLDEYLISIHGERQNKYNECNAIDHINTAIVAYWDGVPAGCGCFKPMNSNRVEIKRLFVKREYRNRNIATAILAELENWIKEYSYFCAVLSTGFDMHDAINFYKNKGYEIIPNYDSFVDDEYVICMKKNLSN